MVWLLGIARGLAELHSLLPEAIVHRDIKAANILLNGDATVTKISDFGLAESMQTTAASVAQSVAVAGGIGSKGGMAGTLAWKAPETFAGKYSAESDVFALGVTGYEVISRQQPFAAESATAILDKVSARFKVRVRPNRHSSVPATTLCTYRVPLR